jgi:hypothetical protein
MPKQQISTTTTTERAAKHDSLMPLLSAMFREFQEFAKKKPEGVLSKNKVKIVNRLLTDILTIVQDEPSRPFLDLLDEDDLPQNSDVLLMLGQFVAAMEGFHEKYWRHDPVTYKHRWWLIEEK